MTQEQVFKIIRALRILETQLYVLITILTFVCVLMLTGCGIDPDDFKAKKSDGCPSSGCVPEEEQPGQEGSQEPKEPATEEHVQTSTTETRTVTTTTTTVEDDDKQDTVVCEEGKLCKGMTKEQVLAVIGEPQTIDKILYMTYWEWEENPGEAVFCAERYTAITNRCSLEFSGDKLWKAKDFKSEWLDVLSF
jgi:hypothetical protein